MSIKRRAALLLLALAGCDRSPAAIGAPEFPSPDRPVARIVSSRWSGEQQRDRAGEAAQVMRIAGVGKGMTVADIGAGEGYYTVRLAKAVGPDGRVLAEDIVPAYHEALARRVEADRLDNVSVILGETDDPKLPANSFDRVLLVHMYHEIEQPYAFLWHLRPALKPGGRVIVVDADRETGAHGTPKALLACEFAALGFREVDRRVIPQAGGYLAAFEAVGARPAPGAIRPCVAQTVK